MITIISDPSARSLKISKGREDACFSVTSQPVTVVKSGTFDGNLVVDDTVKNRYSTASTQETHTFQVQGDGTVSNRAPEVAEIGQDEIINVLSNGWAHFEVSGCGVTYGLRKSVKLNSPQVTEDEVLKVAGGSLNYYRGVWRDQFDFSQFTMEVNGKVFTVQEHASGIYQRNPNLWCGNHAGLTCASPWNSDSQNRNAGTLITPRHFVNANHYRIAEGATIRFVAEDNTVVDRTVLRRLPWPYFPTKDLCLYVLNEDVPSSIVPAYIPPANNDYARGFSVDISERKILNITLDQEEKALVSLSVGSLDVSAYEPVNTDMHVLYEDKIGGDSGSPVFTFIEDKCVFVGTLTMGGVGSGPATRDVDWTDYIQRLDALAGISGVDNPAWPNAGGHYTEKRIDLSRWPNFAQRNYIIENSDLANGNVFLWVENGTQNGKPKYRLSLDPSEPLMNYTLACYQIGDDYVWRVYHDLFLLATSTDDTPTPVGAIFDNGWSFTTFDNSDSQLIIHLQEAFNAGIDGWVAYNGAVMHDMVNPLSGSGSLLFLPQTNTTAASVRLDDLFPYSDAEINARNYRVKATVSVGNIPVRMEAGRGSGAETIIHTFPANQTNTIEVTTSGWTTTKSIINCLVFYYTSGGFNPATDAFTVDDVLVIETGIIPLP